MHTAGCRRRRRGCSCPGRLLAQAAPGALCSARNEAMEGTPCCRSPVVRPTPSLRSRTSPAHRVGLSPAMQPTPGAGARDGMSLDSQMTLPGFEGGRWKRSAESLPGGRRPSTCRVPLWSMDRGSATTRASRSVRFTKCSDSTLALAQCGGLYRPTCGHQEEACMDGDNYSDRSSKYLTLGTCH